MRFCACGVMLTADNECVATSGRLLVALRTTTAQHATSAAIGSPSCDRYQDNRAPCGVL